MNLKEKLESYCLHLAHNRLQVVAIWIVSVVILVWRGIKSGWYLGLLSEINFPSQEAYMSMIGELFAAVLILWFYLSNARAGVSDRRLVTKTLNVIALLAYSVLSCMLLMEYKPYVSAADAGTLNLVLYGFLALSIIMIQRRSKRNG